MADIYNGMPASGLGNVRWVKSRYSNPNGECLEMASLPSGEIAVRNSRFPGGPALVYTRAEITAFLAGAKDGEFDGVLLALCQPGGRPPGTPGLPAAVPAVESHGRRGPRGPSRAARWRLRLATRR